MEKTKILVAAATLVGAKAKGETVPFRLLQGEELTAAAKKKLGLAADDLDELISRGHVVETEVRSAAGGKSDSAALEAANKRADEAEAKVKELTDKVEGLEKQLAAAKTQA